MGVLAWAAVTGVGAVTMVAFPPLAGVVAQYLGFSAAGPIAGSLAAGAQAYMGNIAAGSTFAYLQAAAMAIPTP